MVVPVMLVRLFVEHYAQDISHPESCLMLVNKSSSGAVDVLSRVVA